MSALLTQVDSASVEGGMFISHGIWLWRTRGIRKRAKEASLSFDEFPEAVDWQAKGMKITLTSIPLPVRKHEIETRDIQVVQQEVV